MPCVGNEKQREQHQLTPFDWIFDIIYATFKLTLILSPNLVRNTFVSAYFYKYSSLVSFPSSSTCNAFSWKSNNCLTQWGPVMHICFGKLGIGCESGMTLDWSQIIIWTAAVNWQKFAYTKIISNCHLPRLWSNELSLDTNKPFSIRWKYKYAPVPI